MAEPEIDCTPVWRKLLICADQTAGLALAAKGAGEYMTDAEREQAVKLMIEFEGKMRPFLDNWADYHAYPKK